MSDIDRESVERLAQSMAHHGCRWNVGYDYSEQRARDCDRSADTLLALRAALDTAEAEKRAAVAAAYEKAAALCFRMSDIYSTDSHHRLAQTAGICGEGIRALSDTDALAEYAEKVREEC